MCKCPLRKSRALFHKVLSWKLVCQNCIDFTRNITSQFPSAAVYRGSSFIPSGSVEFHNHVHCLLSFRSSILSISSTIKNRLASFRMTSKSHGMGFALESGQRLPRCVSGRAVVASSAIKRRSNPIGAPGNIMHRVPSSARIRVLSHLNMS